MNSSSLALIGFAAFPVVLGAVVGGFAEAPGRSGIRTVTVTATDYALEAPDSLPAGAVTFRLVNRGKEFHHLWVARLQQGKTAEDVLAALKTPGPLPGWVHEVGGPNAPAPGGASNATVSLTVGNYVIGCLIPSADGVRHLMKGMVRSLIVVESPMPTPDPVGNVTMTLHDYSFALTQPLTPGRHLIEVRNNGRQPHEIELVQLAPGNTAAEVLAWVHEPMGSPPGLPLGGVAPLARGGVAWFEVDLQPGKYALICFLPDAKDGKAHYEHGMVQEIDVGTAMGAR
jgi:uncharacterized cupredoxin-like copper-binding protein